MMSHRLHHHDLYQQHQHHPLIHHHLHLAQLPNFLLNFSLNRIIFNIIFFVVVVFNFLYCLFICLHKPESFFPSICFHVWEGAEPRQWFNFRFLRTSQPTLGETYYVCFKSMLRSVLKLFDRVIVFVMDIGHEFHWYLYLGWFSHWPVGWYDTIPFCFKVFQQS